MRLVNTYLIVKRKDLGYMVNAYIRCQYNTGPKVDETQ